MKLTEQERVALYWTRVDKRGEDECWPWTGRRNVHGYGTFAAGRAVSQLAHRWAYATFVGPLGTLHVCHTCDNPACQNPRHWFLGTPADNSADKVAKNRHACGSLPGMENPASRLTDEQVTEIRSRYRDGATQQELADDFGVGQAQVSRITRGKQWRDGTPAIDGSRRAVRGAAHPHARLTRESVAEIRARYAAGSVSQAALAREYGVSQASVSSVILRQTWANCP